MKGCLVVPFLLCLTTLICAEDLYTDQFDSIDIDEILQSQRLLDNYFHCLKTGQKCTTEGLKLKEILPDALKTECSKCTQVQKDKAKKVIKFLIKNKPDMFKELEDIYDPTHEYRTRYADKLKAEGLEFPN